MKKGIRWGILGPGKIAITFAEAVNLIGEDVIVAVASHDERKRQHLPLSIRLPTGMDPMRSW